MDDTESSFSYCPDFSDICSDDSTFWDFLKNDGDENEIISNQGDSKTNLYFVELESSSNVPPKENEGISKLQEYSNVKLTVPELDIKRHVPMPFESILEKSSKSGFDSVAFKVPCPENNIKNISNDDEDEFWDFLKSDCVSSIQGNAGCKHRTSSSAELEEIRRLSSLNLYSMNEPSVSGISGFKASMDSNTTTPHVDANLLCKHSTPAEILRDLDVIMSEIDSTSELQRKCVGKSSLSDNDNEKTCTSNAICENNIFYSDSDLVPNSVGLRKENIKSLEVSDRKPLNSFEVRTKNRSFCTFLHEAKFNGNVQMQKILETNTQTCSQQDKMTEQNMNSVKKHIASSNIVSHSQNKGCKNLASSEYNLVADTNKPLERIPNQPYSIKNVPQSNKKENNAHLPVISSIFSISSCPNIFDQQEFSTEKQNIKGLKDFSTNNVEKYATAGVTDQNTIVSYDKYSSLFETNSSFEHNVNARNSIKNTSPIKNKNTKCFLQQNSPKNSMFRITDCHTTVNDIQSTENSVTEAINHKRQKITKAINSSDIKYQRTSIAKDEKGHPAVPVKYIVLPNSTLGTNSTTVSNPTPLYLIMPKVSQSENNQNVELVMVVNKNNLTVNNSDVKISTNLTNYSVTVPAVSCSSKIVDSQIPNYNHQSIGQGIQHISLPSVNVMNLQDNPNAFNASFNSSRSALTCDPMLKTTVNNTVKLQLPINVSSNKINILPASLPQMRTKTENANFYSVPVGGLFSNIRETPLPQANIPISILANNNPQLRNINSEKDRQSLTAMSNLFPKNLQPNVIPQSISGVPVPLQRFRQIQQKFKPIKSISLGKDKNAIQQISIPLKMDSLTDPKVLGNVYNFGISSNSDSFYTHRLKTPNTNNKVQSSQVPLVSEKQELNINEYNKVFEFVPQKRNSDGLLVKRNLITNETEVMKKIQFLNIPPNSQLHVANSANLKSSSEIKFLGDKVGTYVANSLEEDANTAQLMSTEISNYETCFKGSNETNIFPSAIRTKSDNISSNALPQTSELPQSTLATLQELFPPPISMVPVCVMQTVQTACKPSVSKVLVLQSSSEICNEATKQKAQRKTTGKKTTTIRAKKGGRKTVRQLLEERNQHATADRTGKSYHPPVEKVLRPIYKLVDNGTLVPTAVPFTDGKFSSTVNNGIFGNETERFSSIIDNTNKRPNIMMLPSATKVVQDSILQEDRGKKSSQIYGSSRQEEASFNIFDTSADFLFDNMIVSKDYKPRYYDMCELRIGYFKVEDDVDSCGQFHSKFKVLFPKRQFLYEFPVTKCNQVDLNNCITCEQMVHIQVPFQSVVAINVNNRQINIQLNRFPQICLRRTRERCDLKPKMKDYFEDNYLWNDAVQNSLFHKILLRKRQADNLKTYLCQFDPNFFLLFSIGNNIGLKSMLNVNMSPFEDLVSANVRKLYQKNKKNAIRRLPQWDSEAAVEPIELMKGDQLLSSNQVCSCRISCKSLRCSCVKAVKSCSTGGTMCLCTNCDNPLNVLDSLGINLDFSLSDCCLFQNIYRIPKLRTFLQRDVKLSCCNTVARVLDCIPGTILCPNTECNESLEFSWCQVIICYPERNPRNHCSFCGLCCFSKKRHCQICNRCYVVTSKSLDCPNCRGSGITIKPACQGINMQGNYLVETLSTKSCSKPEIIILDNTFNTKHEVSLKKEEIVSPETYGSHVHVENDQKEDKKCSAKEELVKHAEQKVEVNKYDKLEAKRENCKELQENNFSNGNKPVLKEAKAEEIDGCRDVLLVVDVKRDKDSLVVKSDAGVLSKNIEQSHQQTGETAAACVGMEL